MENQEWYVKIELTVAGPKEKPIILSGTYLGTNKDVAMMLQNRFGRSIEELNSAKKREANKVVVRRTRKSIAPKA